MYTMYRGKFGKTRFFIKLALRRPNDIYPDTLFEPYVDHHAGKGKWEFPRIGTICFPLMENNLLLRGPGWRLEVSWPVPPETWPQSGVCFMAYTHFIIENLGFRNSSNPGPLKLNMIILGHALSEVEQDCTFNTRRNLDELSLEKWARGTQGFFIRFKSNSSRHEICQDFITFLESRSPWQMTS